MNIKQRLRIILYSFSVIREKIYINKACMKFEGVFNHLIKLHKERYKLYFSGDKEKIETYSEKIEFVGKKLLELGELLISNKLTSKNNKIKLKEMMKKTEKLMTEIKS